MVFSSRVEVARAPTNAEEGVSGWMGVRSMSASSVREPCSVRVEYVLCVHWCVVFHGCGLRRDILRCVILFARAAVSCVWCSAKVPSLAISEGGTT